MTVRQKYGNLLIKSLKIALSAVFAIALAGELGLQYSATAGIITVLSIGNTKRETFRSVRNRGLAYLCALTLAAVFFYLVGYNLAAFALYLFCFAMLCLWMGWKEAITADSVLVTHLLAAESMAFQPLWNETLLFAIGACTGILVNLHLHPKAEEFERLADAVDEQVKGILHSMYLELSQEEPAKRGQRKEDLDAVWEGSSAGGEYFEELDRRLTAARDCAAANHKNTLFPKDSYELDYITMRRQQSNVLRGIYENIRSIEYLPVQAGQVAGLIAEIEKDYHRSNHVNGLLDRMGELLAQMKKQELPASREEFEARALLFYILMQLEDLLEIKRRFLLCRGGSH